MDLSPMWDTQVLVYTALSTVVVLIVLWVLALFNRQLRFLTIELASLRREVELIDESTRFLASVLKDRPAEKLPDGGSLPLAPAADQIEVEDEDSVEGRDAAREPSDQDMLPEEVEPGEPPEEVEPGEPG